MKFIACFATFFFLAHGVQSAERDLNQSIQETLQKTGLEGTPHSIQIINLSDGKVLFEENPDLALNPASNVKLITAATSLKELGPDFTFKTEFYSDHRLNGSGVIHNLWIKGYGDPLFVTEELDSVVQQLVAMGLKKIDGNIYVDDTYFDQYHLTTYLSDVNEKVYSIVTGPLSFNFNSIQVHARPGRRLGDQPIVSLDPPTRYVKVLNKARTTSDRGGPNLEADMKKNHENDFIIRGGLPRSIREYSFRHGILEPAFYTGTVIAEALENAGVEIDWKPHDGILKREPVPSKAFLLLTHSSPPLKEVLKGLGKFSNNFIAEQLVKTVSAVKNGPPGSTSQGLNYLRKYLLSLKVPEKSFLIDNGSGLSRLTRLSASHFICVLEDVYHAPWRLDLINALSIAGIDGTLKNRMKDSSLVGKIYAKTGTLNNASSLSGFLFDSHHQIAFSFIFNDFQTSHDAIHRAEASILEKIARTVQP